MLIGIARPLFFASVQPTVAAAHGLPVRGLAAAFLVLLAFAVAQAVQVVGVLLIFALLVTPAAHRALTRIIHMDTQTAARIAHSD